MTISPYFTEGLLLQLTCGVLFFVTGLAGLGMYEANAIQFGMDQMLEASSEQLSSFIHWYFWCVISVVAKCIYIYMLSQILSRKFAHTISLMKNYD